MKIVAIIQARVNSTRLPRKVLLPLGDRTVLEQVISRVQKSSLIDEIIVATTTNPEDSKIAKLAKKAGASVFRGSEDDVLDRFCQAARQYLADHVVRITADCPLIDPYIIDQLIKQHLNNQNDYTANTVKLSYPDGQGAEIMTMGTLEKSWLETDLASEREHVTHYIRSNEGHFKIGNLAYHTDHSAKRWTLDNQEDYDFLASIFESLQTINPMFHMEDVLEFLSKNPEIEKLNQHIGHNEGLKKSLDADHRIVRRNNNMGKGQILYKKAKKIIPGGTQLLSKRPEMFLPDYWPAYYSKAKGCEIWDLDNNKHTDMSYMGIGACVLGYADPDVNLAVKKVIDEGNASTLNAPEEVELAKLMIKIHPWSQMARFARTGGEAMAIAVRIARASSGKDKILFCGYHGWHDWYISSNLADDKALDGHLISGLDPKGVPRALKGTAIPFAYNDTKTFLSLVKKHESEIGVVVIEPIRNHQPTPDFLKMVQKESRRIGAVLVVDEVSSGFRLNGGGAHLELGLEPDIAVFSKALGNGYPIAAIIGKSKIMSIAEETFISSTNWTERTGFAAAIATIKKFRKNKAYLHLNKMGNSIQKGWKTLAKKHGLQIEISGIPALCHFDFKYENSLTLKTLFTQFMLEEGFLATNAFYASLAHNNKHIVNYLAATDKTFFRIAKIIQSGSAEKELRGPVCHTGFRRLT